MADERLSLEEWRLRPWAIALLILTAIAFGAQLVMVGMALLTISMGVMLAAWTILLIAAVRNRTAAAGLDSEAANDGGH